MNILRCAFAVWKKSECRALVGRVALHACLLLVGALLFANSTVASGGPLHSELESHANWFVGLGCAGVYHVVRPGQTIYSIAALYNSTAYRIKVCNRLRSYSLYVGQRLIVPTRYSMFGSS